MNQRTQPSAAGSDGLTDADLARHIAEPGGGTAAAEEAELCRRYERRIYWYGLRHLRTDDRARDLVQEVLVLTLEKLRAGAVRDPERIGSFILGAARLTARSMGRAGSREEGLEAAGDVRSSADPSASDPIARDRMVHCLHELAERLRTVIVLTYYGEQSTASIASSLGLTANNVRVIRHRGIAQLRGCLGLGDRGAAA